MLAINIILVKSKCHASTCGSFETTAITRVKEIFLFKVLESAIEQIVTKTPGS